jgi:hypothetical protein
MDFSGGVPGTRVGRVSSARCGGLELLVVESGHVCRRDGDFSRKAGMGSLIGDVSRTLPERLLKSAFGLAPM